ncbi:hypothetical protein [Streptomyces sp. NPDC050856]|uniref:hypothetical protein n=1 Tax=Streptomyces sp. NPDC050856 TaxID=3154939 RepID=UPI0033C724ED
MAEVVDADELLRRIRVARDWAADEEQRCADRARAGADGAPDGAPSSDEVSAAAYRAVRVVLDKLIDPSGHSGGT